MQLLTHDIIAKIPSLYATEGIAPEDKNFVCKFFTPDANFTWYVCEGQYENGDYLMFGLVDGFEKEWGYFSLSELKSVTGPLGMSIERDIFFENQSAAEFI